MKLRFVGYSYNEHRKNPDQTIIYDGQPLYEADSGVVADGYWLVEHIYHSGGLGDNPEIPDEYQHWFKSEAPTN